MSSLYLENMKGVTLASTFVVALFLLASALTPPIKADIFDDYGTLLASGPYILFPVNTTYNSRIITLNISFSTKLFSPIHLSATYSLDGTPNINAPRGQTIVRGVFRRLDNHGRLIGRPGLAGRTAPATRCRSLW